MFRRKVRLIGDEMLHRFGICRDRSWARLRYLIEMCLTKDAPHQRCASPEVGNAAAWTAVQGLLLRDYGT